MKTLLTICLILVASGCGKEPDQIGVTPGELIDGKPISYWVEEYSSAKTPHEKCSILESLNEKNLRGYLSARPLAIPILLTALRDEDQKVREEAINGLGIIGSAAVYKALESNVYSEEDKIIARKALEGPPGSLKKYLDLKR